MTEQTQSGPAVEPAFINFLNNFPAVEIAQKQYSLEADILTGWKPKLKILGPIPLNFDSPITDQIVEELTSFGRKYKERVIYLGHRYPSSFKMHQQMARKYHFKHEAAVNTNYLHMAAYFRKFHANFKAKNARIFKGMNPTIKPNEQLTFDSNFESGNLDVAVKVRESEYDLFMRVDSNTRGHVQWFNFSVVNCGKKKVRFNIVNFRKSKTIYQRGMKPYVYSEFLKQTKQLDWFQGGENVKYSRRKLNYEFLEDDYNEETITFNCLQFDYTFETDWEHVQFAYSPPFTYTDTTDLIKKLKSQENPTNQEPVIREETLCESLGGLDIPLLTITDPHVDNQKKKCILISGRIHPGQTCGSFMGKGVLQQICADTQEAKYLRRNIVFKVIPMLNPDGVVSGNFRTSFCGQDLNRAFKNNVDLLIPEVKGLKQLVVKLRNEYKSRLIFFLDLHGHSVKKNVFLYGPEYQIWESNYYKTRIFPKILSSNTDIFRYYSCLFRIADFKRTTARAVILRNIPHCYTIQASTGFYYSAEQKCDIAFTAQKWEFMGRVIADSVKDYLDLLYDEELTKIERKQKILEMKTYKNRSQSKKHGQKNNKFQTRILTIGANSKSKNFEDEQKQHQIDEYQSLPKKARDMIEAIRNEQKTRQEGLKEDGHESDQFSEGGSDSESAQDDIPAEELKNLQQEIMESLEEFKNKFYSKNQRQFSVKQSAKKDVKQLPRPKKQSKGIELIASLRKKAQSIQKAKQVFVWNRVKEELREKNDPRGNRRIEELDLSSGSSFKMSSMKYQSRQTFGLAFGISETELACIKQQSDFRGGR